MSIRRQSSGPEFGREAGPDSKSRERKLSKRIWDRIGLNFGAKSGARARAEGRDKGTVNPLPGLRRSGPRPLAKLVVRRQRRSRVMGMA